MTQHLDNATDHKKGKNYIREMSRFSPARAGVGEGVKDFASVSPVETSIRFNLPSQVTLPESTLQFSAGNINHFKPGNLPLFSYGLKAGVEKC